MVNIFNKLKNKLFNWLLPKAPEILLVEDSVFKDIQELARSAYPKEFVAFLHGYVKKTSFNNKPIYAAVVDGLDIINYKANHNSTNFNLYDLPTMHGTVGTVHSHPGLARPSRADLRLFSKFGWVHLIIGKPYNLQNTRCFDKLGNKFPFNTYHRK